MENTGSINIYAPGNGLPIEHIDVPVIYEETADQIASAVNSIRNKCYAVDELLESIVADLGIIELEHIDDNGKELAQSLKKKFQKMQSDFYWTAIERECNDIENPWMASSLIYMVGLLADKGTQKLVLPMLRENYNEITKSENLTKEEKEKEFAEWLVFIRQDFKLSGDFR